VLREKETVSEIRSWLEAHKLGQYADVFESEQVLVEHLPDLTSDDLKDLGLPLGPRKTLLKAAGPAETESAPSALPQPVPHGHSAAEEHAAVAAATNPEDGNAGPGTASTAGGERRQLTVMFCDLVDSTALSGRLDPEDLRNLVRAYQETAAAIITRYEGHIAQYLGDGLLVYFGHPHAHEDDARRAVHAGLGIIDGMGALNTRLQSTNGVQLAVRLGIHTGLVVIGEMGGGEQHGQLALGETPNIAARLEGLAAPDTIVISAATVRLVQSAFALEDLGLQSLKGVTEPMMIARVLQPSAAPSDATEEPADGGRFLIGRDEEVGLLRRRWEQSSEGAGQAVVVTGEAGIGKSVLVETLFGRVAEAGGARITFRCSPYHQNSTLYPIIEHLRRVFQFDRDDTPAAKLRKLERQLQAYQFIRDETIPLFAALLSLPVGRYPTLTFSPQQQKVYTHDALVAWLTEEAERTPLLVVFEDLHWADASTMEMVGAIVEEVPTLRMLAVSTARPEFVPPWPPRSHLTQLTLNRLERPHVAALVTYLARGKTLPEEVVQHLVNKTDGVPLFVEELTKMLLESDVLRPVDGGYELTGPLTNVTIPSTLQDSLMARLDRLPEGKEVAQLGAVLGREFTYEMIEALTTGFEGKLQARLGELVEAELLYQRGRPPRSKYTFKHALIQDAAYTSLLHSTRRAYHEAVAQLLEQQFPDLVESQPELIAHHYTEAAALEQAILYWLKAGQRAGQRSANVDAISHFNNGIEGLEALPEGADRDARELDLKLGMSMPLIAIKGYAAPETQAVSERAIALCSKTGQVSRVFPALYGLWTYSYISSQTARCRELAADFLELANAQAEMVPRMVGQRCLGASSLVGGSPTIALHHLEQAWALFDPVRDAESTISYGGELGASIRTYQSSAACLCGYPQRARRWGKESVARALATDHANNTGATLLFNAVTAWLLRDRQSVTQYIAELQTVCDSYNLPFWEALGMAYQAAVLGWEGRPEEGLEKFSQGTEARANNQIIFLLPGFVLIKADLLRNLGRTQDALASIAEGLDFSSATQERWCDPELHRVRGELYASSSQQGDTEAAYSDALTIARAQEAKWWELRATVSLARLWQRQNKTSEARELLAPIYNWFTEGFDTQDLKEAKVLLKELG
jgi:class 3 adenylate cyclase/predicted ATPase